MKDTDQLDIRPVDGGVVLAVKVVPGASRDKVVGVLGRSLKIATSAAPEKGKANQAVARTLAKALGTDRRRVELVGGPASANKQFRIAGLTVEQVRRRLS